MAVAAAALESGTALRKAKKKRRKDELPFVAVGPPTNGKKLGAAEVLALQKLFGNKATQEALHKQATAGPVEEPAATEERFVSSYVREMLKKQLKERMEDAAENYVRAWEAVRKDLAVEANFSPEFARILVETFMSDHGELSRDLFRQLASMFPILEGPGMDTPTLRGLEHAKELKDFNEEHGKDPIEDATEKVGKSAAALGSGVETRVIDAIKDALRDIVKEIDDKDEELSDLELLILWTNYDRVLVKEELYKAMVRIMVAEAKRQRMAIQAKQRVGLGGGKGTKTAAGGDTGDGGGGAEGNGKKR